MCTNGNSLFTNFYDKVTKYVNFMSPKYSVTTRPFTYYPAGSVMTTTVTGKTSAFIATINTKLSPTGGLGK